MDRREEQSIALQAKAKEAEATSLLFDCWRVVSNPASDPDLVARANAIADQLRPVRDFYSIVAHGYEEVSA